MLGGSGLAVVPAGSVGVAAEARTVGLREEDGVRVEGVEPSEEDATPDAGVPVVARLPGNALTDVTCSVDSSERRVASPLSGEPPRATCAGVPLVSGSRGAPSLGGFLAKANWPQPKAMMSATGTSSSPWEKWRKRLSCASPSTSRIDPRLCDNALLPWRAGRPARRVHRPAGDRDPLSF